MVDFEHGNAWPEPSGEEIVLGGDRVGDPRALDDRAKSCALDLAPQIVSPGLKLCDVTPERNNRREGDGKPSGLWVINHDATACFENIESCRPAFARLRAACSK